MGEVVGMKQLPRRIKINHNDTEIFLTYDYDVQLWQWSFQVVHTDNFTGQNADLEKAIKNAVKLIDTVKVKDSD